MIKSSPEISLLLLYTNVDNILLFSISFSVFPHPPKSVNFQVCLLQE